MSDSKHHTVSVDGQEQTYSIRGLSEEEIAPWAVFCAGIFAYKPQPPPPAYFERHFHNDPRRDASLVRVAVDEETGAIVASCRVFARNCAALGVAGGIGEVCTHREHRRRGLSKVLLTDALEIMKDRKMPSSLLHAAPAFFPVYESVGYSCVPSKWSLVDVKVDVDATADAPALRPARFPDDTETLRALHETFSVSNLAGCIVRSEEYWNEYISKELEGSLFVVPDPEDDSVLAWASVRQRGPAGQYQLREFGADASKISVGDALAKLVPHGIKRLSDDGAATCKLSLPTFVLDQVDSSCSFLNLESKTENNDNGWMYKTILEDAVHMNDIAGTVEDSASKMPHLIWPADSF